ncbi:hypothetical protein ACLB2K_056988 [Fragaria x ananassa]
MKNIYYPIRRQQQKEKQQKIEFSFIGLDLRKNIDHISSWNYKNARRELMTHDISHIKQTWRKVLRVRKQKHNDQYSFLVKFDNQRLEKLKRNIENSSDNWSRGAAAIELSEFMFNQIKIDKWIAEMELIGAYGLD